MKKLFSIAAAAFLICTFSATATASVMASPNRSAVYVNGASVAFQAYTINGSNYFRLRDLAYALNGTAKQFQVTYDGIRNRVELTLHKSYTAVGGEMTASASTGTMEAVPTSSAVYLDGAQILLTAFVIGESKYARLRDVAAAVDFAVTWDGSRNAIAIDTSTGYKPDAPSAGTAASPDVPAVPQIPPGAIYTKTDPVYSIQNEDGTPGDDVIVQIADASTGAQGIDGWEGNDWFLQEGGAATVTQSVTSDADRATTYQFAGSHDITQVFQCSAGIQSITQVGGGGLDEMLVDCSYTSNGASATIRQYAGTGKAVMNTKGGGGKDQVFMYGGPLDDGFVYNCTAGSDSVMVNGGGGKNELTVFLADGIGLTLTDAAGKIIYQTAGTDTTRIAATNVADFYVCDPNGNLIYPAVSY